MNESNAAAKKVREVVSRLVAQEGAIAGQPAPVNVSHELIAIDFNARTSPRQEWFRTYPCKITREHYTVCAKIDKASRTRWYLNGKRISLPLVYAYMERRS